jgi:multidrug transporter EmrE-like cation transporter
MRRSKTASKLGEFAVDISIDCPKLPRCWLKSTYPGNLDPKEHVMPVMILMFSAIVLNVCGHLFLKAGMNRVGAISVDQLVVSFSKIFTTPFVVLGLLSYVSSVAMYMVVLSKVDISYAYPLMMGLGYVMIVLFSWQIFGEPFSTFKWIGIILILAGLSLLGK